MIRVARTSHQSLPVASRKRGRRGAVFAAAIAALTVLHTSGCGRGRYVAEGLTLAQQRQAQMKSGTEWSMAHQAFLAGDLDKAMTRIERSLAINPEVAKSHALLGRILMEQSHLGPALRAFAEASRLDPELVDAHYYAGVALERLDRPADAFLSYDRAATLDPGNAQHAVAAAEMLIDQGRAPDAREYLEHYQAEHEFSAGVKHTLGHIALLEGRSDLAERLLREAVLLAPDDPSIVVDLIDAQLASGRFALAERHLAELLRRPEMRDRRDLAHLRARCLVELDRLVEARRVLQELTKGDAGRSDPEAWIALARVSLSLGLPAELKDAADQAVAVAPDRHEGYLYQAMWHRIRGEHAEAIKRVAQATQRSPGAPEIPMLRAFILQDLGRPAEALAALHRAHELDPVNPEIARLIDGLESHSRLAGVQSDE